MDDTNNGHATALVVDPVDDAVGAAAGAVSVMEWGTQSLAHPMRNVQQRADDELVSVYGGVSPKLAVRAGYRSDCQRPMMPSNAERIRTPPLTITANCLRRASHPDAPDAFQGLCVSDGTN